jgi:hypothetical protein
MSTDVRSRLQASLGDRYRMERELGRGGMATVYLAHDLRHDRPVALKVFHPELGAALGERFLREIRVAARLGHPHILTVHDSGDADGHLWYTMPVVDGESLRQRIKREGPLPLEEALRIGRSVAEALDFAHSHGVVHRDIKPENILLFGNEPMVAALARRALSELAKRPVILSEAKEAMLGMAPSPHFARGQGDKGRQRPGETSERRVRRSCRRGPRLCPPRNWKWSGSQTRCCGGAPCDSARASSRSAISQAGHHSFGGIPGYRCTNCGFRRI